MCSRSLFTSVKRILLPYKIADTSNSKTNVLKLIQVSYNNKALSPCLHDQQRRQNSKLYYSKYSITLMLYSHSWTSDIIQFTFTKKLRYIWFCTKLSASMGIFALDRMAEESETWAAKKIRWGSNLKRELTSGFSSKHKILAQQLQRSGPVEIF